jgi:hypothetical protein
MATTTTALSLRNPAGGDSINVTTDISANNTKVDNQFRKGSTLTSNSSLPLGDEWMNEVTGSTTITSLSTKNAGLRQLLKTTASVQFTHSSALSLPNDTNIAAVAGDWWLFESQGSGNWELIGYQLATGGILPGGAATAAEVNTGTDTSRPVTPDSLAGSTRGEVEIQVPCFAVATDTATGNSKAEFTISNRLAGMNIKRVFAFVSTAGVTGTLDIQIRNKTQAADVLSTKITIDTTELHSATAATPAAINTSEDDLTENDIIAIDVDAIHSGTAAKGLVVGLICGTP